MKRCVDVVLASVMLLLCSPLMLLIAMLVILTDPGPALYWSDRVGKRSRMFSMPKFRTMQAGTPQVSTDRLLDAKKHLTPIGGFLRKLSLDELPQLWSVIRGDMSLVGPRPALHNQHELIRARREAGVDDLRPGITGWAQVNGRDELSDERKLAFDCQYVERAGLGFDIRILLLTALRVARRDGVAH